MNTLLSARALALAILAPTAQLLALPGVRTQPLSPDGSASLGALFDPALGSLRAGRADLPASPSADERSELRVAQQKSPSLAELRGGSEPTDSEWKWLGIGAGIVLLIFLI